MRGNTGSGHTLGGIAAACQGLAGPGGIPAPGNTLSATLAMCLTPPLFASGASCIHDNWVPIAIPAPLARAGGTIDWEAPLAMAGHCSLNTGNDDVVGLRCWSGELSTTENDDDLVCGGGASNMITMPPTSAMPPYAYTDGMHSLKHNNDGHT